jgi:two-component system, chemotaxis family, protein-glutamate methylesterase/glutaminase
MPARSMRPAPEPASPLVLVATSAGGLRALSTLLGDLPRDFPAPLLVVQHLSPGHESHLAAILTRRTPLEVKQAEAGELPRAGVVHIAPPDHHLLLAADGSLSLSPSAVVRHVRPSADLLFESVADHFTGRVIAVVLTGMQRDGAQGVRAIKQRGGTVIVQDPATAEFPGMPTAAVETGSVDQVLPLSKIAPALVALAMDGVKG